MIRNQNIKEILNIKFSVLDVIKSAPTFDNVRRSYGFNKVNELSKKYYDLQPKPTQLLISKVYRHFINSIISNTAIKEIIKNKREAKALAWCLDYVDVSDEFKIVICDDDKYLRPALLILDKYFSQVMIQPVFMAFMNSWPYPKESLLAFIKEVIISRIRSRHPISRCLSYNEDFLFFFNGPDRLANLFAAQNNRPKNVCNFMSLPDHYVKTKYMGQFSVSHVENILRRNVTIEQITDEIELIERLADDIVKKRILVRIICKLGDGVNLSFINILRPIIYSELGDPDTGMWSIASSSENEKENNLFKDARRIFKQWLVRESIELFFDMLSVRIDPHGFQYRKAFWLAYTQHIESFRLIVSTNIISRLKSNTEQWQSIENKVSRFAQTVDSEECAFLFKISDKIFVEFGRTGNALYVYNHTSPNSPDLNKRKYYMSDLKYNGFRDFSLIVSDEGKLIHSRSERYLWQYNLKSWLARRLNVTTNKSFKI